MNMKKTIAAVAACAVAVSAMATTVSAESINYSLVVETKMKTESVTLKVEIDNQTVVDGTNDFELEIKAPGIDFSGKSITLVGSNKDTGRPINYTIVSDGGAADYAGLATGTVGSYIVKIGKSSTLYTAFTDTTTNAPSSVRLTATITGDIASGSTITDQSSLNTEIIAGNVDAKFSQGSAAAADVVVTGAYTSSEFVKRTPFKTTLNGISTGTNDVIKQLGTAGVRNDNGGLYNNALAVINDIIANYDEVTFTFNTATSNVATPAYLAANTWLGALQGYGDCYIDNIPGAESWMGVDTYKTFGQHLYNLYGDEATNYVYSTQDYSFTGYNLFAGALIVNDQYSMNLQDVADFDYQASAVSFDWDMLSNGGNVNTYVNYLQTMKLATSTDWYWDSMTIEFSNTEAEDVTSDAGTEAEEDVIEDEDLDVADEEIADDEEEIADEEPVEVIEVVEATNPGTGNAPIALAVIPVALAAAAVVAKKRG